METLVLDRVRIRQFLLAAVLLAAASLASADPRARMATVKVGPHPLRVEVVSTDAERARGLMHRKSLGADDGMLFVFDEPAYHSMWMKNTLIPLSVAFIDAQGVILNILDMEPHTETPNMSAGPSVYAIETNKGWFARKGVKAGDRVKNLPAR
jgi:uncharacterized membrane protein (UPF0127 family)